MQKKTDTLDNVIFICIVLILWPFAATTAILDELERILDRIRKKY